MTTNNGRPYSRKRSAPVSTDPLILAYKQYSAAETDSASTERVRAHFIDHLSADVDVWTATLPEIETWLASHEDWKPSSYNTARNCIRHFYRWAHRYGHRTDNPTEYLRPRRIPRKLARIADDDGLVLAAMKAPADTRAMLLLGAELGLRRAEIAKVHRNDIEDGWLRVLGKGGHERELRLTEALTEVIAFLPAAGFLFPGDHDGHLSADAVYRRIRRVSGFNTHALRHRAATTVYERSRSNLRLTQEFLGHANPAMTARYVHISREHLEVASEISTLGMQIKHPSRLDVQAPATE